MPSRMERYYNSDTEESKRTAKNEELYRKIYDEEEYSNIEGIATLTRNNEVDITKIKDMIQNRENYRNQKRYHEFMDDDEIILEPKIEEYEEKNYDINDILNKAKNEYNKQTYHSLKDNELPDLNRIRKLEEVEDLEEDEKLKGLINTITNTSMLNKLGDKELSLDVLDDLKSNGTTIMDVPSPKSKTINSEMDTTFYTAGMKFKDKDFEELKDMNTNIKKNNKLIKILITIIALIVVATLGILVYKFVIK